MVRKALVPNTADMNPYGSDWGFGRSLVTIAVLFLIFPGISLFYGSAYDSDTSYLWGFEVALLFGIAIPIICLVLWIKGLLQDKPLKSALKASLSGVAIGAILGSMFTMYIGYMRYGRPIEIHQAVSDQYLNKIVSVEGFVSWNGISDGKHVYRLQDPSGTLNVTARDGASAPMVGERVWVLGPIGRTLSGMDKAMLEHARWVKQPQ